MNQEITFTPQEVLSLLLWLCGAIVSISAAVTVIVKVIQKAKEPEHNQDERITSLEKKVERFEQLFDNDNKRLIELERGNRIMQQSMLALLSHALNGNDVDSLKKAKDNLQNYLIDKESVL